MPENWFTLHFTKSPQLCLRVCRHCDSLLTHISSKHKTPLANVMANAQIQPVPAYRNATPEYNSLCKQNCSICCYCFFLLVLFCVLFCCLFTNHACLFAVFLFLHSFRLFIRSSLTPILIMKDSKWKSTYQSREHGGVNVQIHSAYNEMAAEGMAATAVLYCLMPVPVMRSTFERFLSVGARGVCLLFWCVFCDVSVFMWSTNVNRICAHGIEHRQKYCLMKNLSSHMQTAYPPSKYCTNACGTLLLLTQHHPHCFGTVIKTTRPDTFKIPHPLPFLSHVKCEHFTCLGMYTNYRGQHLREPFLFVLFRVCVIYATVSRWHKYSDTHKQWNKHIPANVGHLFGIWNDMSFIYNNCQNFIK